MTRLLLFTLRNPVVRAYSEYLNKRADKTVLRYLHKRIDNKMDKELSDKAPPFAKLVEDVARARTGPTHIRQSPVRESQHLLQLDLYLI